MLAFESIAKPLLFLHLVAAACAIASCVHLTLRLIRLWRSGAYAVQVRTHARVLLISYVMVFVLGGMIYPTYRIRVRRDFLTGVYPVVEALFEIKEHFASVGLVAVIGVFVLAWSSDLKNSAHRMYLPLWIGMLTIILSILSFNTITGWYIAALRSV